jgi:diadenosine tetraphosphate (Ap4A) HIT family hydrolase
VPTSQTSDALFECYRGAYKFGYEGVQNGHWEGFNIGQNIGEVAGQTVTYPHVHMIPRRKGDMADPTGGVRHVIPEKGNYKKHKEQPIVESVNW